MSDEPGRPVDLVLAHVHLRLGSLALARAELETLADRDALDTAGLADLAEARWRMGDIDGAGEAATAALGEVEDGPLIALVVAAEAASHRGRPTDARRYATRAMAMADVTIDDAFAGMPRGHVWPPDATAPILPAPTLFDPLAGAGRPLSGRSVPIAAEPRGTDAAEVADLRSGAVSTARPSEPASLALWSDDSRPADEGANPPGLADDPGRVDDADLPDGDDTLRVGRQALEDGDVAAAAVHLALTLRTEPDLASAVLDAVDGRTERELAFVRGDAYRLVGRERDARRAYADVARPPDPPTPSIDHPAEGDPA